MGSLEHTELGQMMEIHGTGLAVYLWDCRMMYLLKISLAFDIGKDTKKLDKLKPQRKEIKGQVSILRKLLEEGEVNAGAVGLNTFAKALAIALTEDFKIPQEAFAGQATTEALADWQEILNSDNPLGFHELTNAQIKGILAVPVIKKMRLNAKDLIELNNPLIEGIYNETKSIETMRTTRNSIVHGGIGFANGKKETEYLECYNQFVNNFSFDEHLLESSRESFLNPKTSSELMSILQNEIRLKQEVQTLKRKLRTQKRKNRSLQEDMMREPSGMLFEIPEAESDTDFIREFGPMGLEFRELIRSKAIPEAGQAEQRAPAPGSGTGEDGEQTTLSGAAP